MSDAHDDCLARCQEVEAILDSAAWSVNMPLNVSIYQCQDPISHQTAAQQSFLPFELGERWGPAWSTAWFHVTGNQPSELAGQPVYLRFSSSTEALLWQDGVPRQGFDINRDWALISDAGVEEAAVSLFIEAACNASLGTTTFWWDSDETKTQWEESEPGCLKQCALAHRNEHAWQLRTRLEFARLTLMTVGHGHALGQLATQLIHRACDIVEKNQSHLTGKHIDYAIDVLSMLGSQNQLSKDVCVIATGHAHIDTAWLWPIRETRRKCIRTFANVLRLMERKDSQRFCFTATQPQQYQWVMQDAPALFRQIDQRIKEGRWEVSGAMWIEPDCNVPSGESLIRQILHAANFNIEHFGEEHQPSFLFLPDTFGFPASLPQIMKLAGIDLFITNKLSWSQTTGFPFMTFRWRGIDGTEVVSQQTPGHDYNAKLDPERLLAGQQRARSKAGGRGFPYLQPFGFGDGGGGPTVEMIARVGLANELAEMPNVEFGDMRHFASELLTQVASSNTLPLHDGELYLELHRGTLTTHRRLKQANRRAEESLRLAEVLCMMNGGIHVDERTSLQEAWRLTLLNQFHDILPGSSIANVYVDAHRDHEEVKKRTDEIVSSQLDRLISTLAVRDESTQLAVVNSTSHVQQAVVEYEGELSYVAGLDPMSVTIIEQINPKSPQPVVTTERSLDNGVLRVVLNDLGQISSLTGTSFEGNACAKDQSLNQLVLYDDQPEYWEAWDIDESYLEHPKPLNESPEKIEVEVNHPLRGCIRVERQFGVSSRIVQRYILDAASARLDIQTEIQWGESQKLLRALMPVGVNARWATCDIQFGHMRRMTGRKSAWQRARFEFCCHRWMDVSQPGLGVALLNNGVYGHSCHDNMMGLSLVRGSQFPDATADLGVHSLSYSLLPHGGDWRRANVDGQAAALNEPITVKKINSQTPQTDRGGTSARPIELSTSDGGPVEIACLKVAEQGDGTVLRLVETRGRNVDVQVQWQSPISNVALVDLRERPLPGIVIHDSASHQTSLSMRPFEIVTLLAHENK